MPQYSLIALLWTFALATLRHDRTTDPEINLNAIHADLRVRAYEDYSYRRRLFTNAYLEIDATADPCKIIIHDHRDIERIATILRYLHFINAIAYFRSAIFEGDNYIWRANLAFSHCRGTFYSANEETSDILRSSDILNLWGFSAVKCTETKLLPQDESYTDVWRTKR